MTTVRIACAQLAPALGDLEGNRRRSLRAIDDAAAAGSGLVVLPELCSSGYVFAGRDEAAAAAEPADGPTVTAWAEAAARHRLVVVGGFAEADAGELFNSAVLVDGDGVRAVSSQAAPVGTANSWCSGPAGSRRRWWTPLPVGSALASATT